MTTSGSPTRLDLRSRLALATGLVALLTVFIGSAAVSYVNTRTLNHDSRRVAHTYEVIATLSDVMSLMKDAETGQRGYLITGDDRYRAPYDAAATRISERLQVLERLTADDPPQQVRVSALRGRVDARLAILAEVIGLRRTEGFEAAQASVLTDRGKSAMDAVRELAADMDAAERALLHSRNTEMDVAYDGAVQSGLLAGLAGLLLTVAIGYLVRRGILQRQREDWFREGEAGLAKVLVGEQRPEETAENALGFLLRHLDAQAGALFVEDGDGFRRAAALGPAADGVPRRIGANDGVPGRALRERRTILVRDLPDDYFAIGSALGRGKPRHLLVGIAQTEGRMIGVVELGFTREPEPATLELFEKSAESLAVALRSAAYRAHLQELLEETQRQAEELQAQQVELRVSNEELEEQSRALRESQARLELQQTELEQTNAHLEEQTQMLEAQRDDLNRSANELQAQARALEQAGRYKSDFLANMSHELRTPLNSSLILAKLLADNPQGNLTEEQVRYAETIGAAGNDLLTLINDILDLSKIESGHMDIRPETFRIAGLLDDVERLFRLPAEQKGLSFRAEVAEGCPETLDTDRRRLEQVLKNLLSNGVKFTDHGEVALVASATDDGRVAFAVSDTGIGIAEHQRDVIFEAFRQADGTTNRRYGGTGLGLSISRELARLLGGEIRLTSEAGRGSTFTVVLPRVYDPAAVRPAGGVAKAPASETPPAPAAAEVAPDPPRRASSPALPFEDDRRRLAADRRVILVVEDDPAFAHILFDLAHELEFQCLTATTAEEGFAAATQFLPSAVVLDVGLPDHSGLSVLDRLKHDARTRHIPVHVVSAGDYAEAALSLGAVGHMLKPVKREELVEALRRMEHRLEQRMRRILIVEDDPAQLEALKALLRSSEVDALGVRTAAECLARQRDSTFDCMVLDLSLPDASGYALLETLSREDAYSFPPVIVYTGRDLSAEEEQRLRKYSKSIIIKGAKSPERLLDEVTLFLHQVVAELPPEQRRMLEQARSRDAALEGRRVLVVEDDVRNVFALTSILEPRGATVRIARNGREALDLLGRATDDGERIDLVLMDVMMPELDGISAVREIRRRPEWRKLPIIMLTAKAMNNDQEHCLSAGANDYMAKPLDVEKLLSLVRVWMPR